jgi:hypothetical protein
VDNLYSHKKVYFAGDTGYHTMRDGEDEDKVPVCPAFAQVGECFGARKDDGKCQISNVFP